MTTQPALPDGARIRLARRTRVQEGGRVLVGGAPTRVARLVPAAAALLRGRELTVSDATSRRLAEHLMATGLGEPVAASLPDVPLASLTVVIPVKERVAPLSRLLASLPPGLARVIVVDDGSEDADAVAAAVRAGGAELIRLDENAGPAIARNTGLARVATEFVAFVDSDVVLAPESLGLLLRHFADPHLALAAPRVLSTAVADPTWITRYEDARSSLDLGGDAASVRPRSPVTWVSSTTLVGRVAALGDGFDPRMRVGEDVDIVWRLVEQGWRVRFEPSAIVRHEPRASVGTWLGRKRFYGTGAHPLGERHPRDIAPAVLPWWGVALLVLGALQRRWAAAAAVAVIGGVLVRIARTLRHVRHPWRLSARLTATSLVATTTQGIALLVRHWWPAAAVAAVFSRRARRLVLAAAVIDSVWEYLRLRPRLDPVRFAIARRLDDLAYGWGVWESAVRGRSIRALLPAVTSSSQASRGPAGAPGTVPRQHQPPA